MVKEKSSVEDERRSLAAECGRTARCFCYSHHNSSSLHAAVFRNSRRDLLVSRRCRCSVSSKTLPAYWRVTVSLAEPVLPVESVIVADSVCKPLA